MRRACIEAGGEKPQQQIDLIATYYNRKFSRKEAEAPKEKECL
jgi:hypothetical protein